MDLLCKLLQIRFVPDNEKELFFWLDTAGLNRACRADFPVRLDAVRSKDASSEPPVGGQTVYWMPNNHLTYIATQGVFSFACVCVLLIALLSGGTGWARHSRSCCFAIGRESSKNTEKKPMFTSHRCSFFDFSPQIHRISFISFSRRWPRRGSRSESWSHSGQRPCCRSCPARSPESLWQT